MLWKLCSTHQLLPSLHELLLQTPLVDLSIRSNSQALRQPLESLDDLLQRGWTLHWLLHRLSLVLWLGSVLRLADSSARLFSVIGAGEFDFWDLREVLEGGVRAEVAEVDGGEVEVGGDGDVVRSGEG